MNAHEPAKDPTSGAAAAPRPCSLENIQQFLASSPVGISISRLRDGLVLYMNDEFLRLLGFRRDEVVGRTSRDLNLWVTSVQRDGIAAEFQARGQCAPRPIPMRRKDGAVITVLFSASSVPLGDEPHTVAWVMDVTERLRTEETLRASEERWRSLALNAPVVIMTLDAEGVVLTLNRSLTGRPVAEYLGRKAVDFLHPDVREQAARRIASTLASGRPAAGEYPVLKPDGSPFWTRVSVSPLAGVPGPERAVLVAIDIDERRQAEEALRASEQRFGEIVRSLGDWIWETDEQGRITFSSPQVEQILGYRPEEMVGKVTLDFAVPDEVPRLAAALGGLYAAPRAVRSFEGWYQHKDGRSVCLSSHAFPIVGPDGSLRGYRGVNNDVTERKRDEQQRRMLEEEVHQARRVESLGMLAGGIAHDFNNLLTAILGNADLALATTGEDSPVRPLLSQIQSAAVHAADLTRQMLTYAGRGRLESRRFDVSTLVRGMGELLASSLPKDVELVFDLGEGLPAVAGDPAQVRQIVMNLVLNGAEAIGSDSGRVTVRTAAGGDAATGADLRIGGLDPGQATVLIEVADTGAGMDRETLRRIFDPFFTTKFTGRGLGLAAVQGIVLRHRGLLAVDSRPGSGSVFRVLLPVAETHEAAAAEPPPSPAGDATPWRGSGLVLVVDDEEPVRTLAARMLAAIGFEALTAAGGAEAIATLGAPDAPGVRAVLLDLTMPHLDGRETLRELRRLRPDLPVILCSGYDMVEGPTRFADLDASGFLQKPYRVADLSGALRNALEAGRNGR